jgi:hypothetical protein
MWSTAQPQTSTRPTHLPTTPNQSLAKQNRKPSQLVEKNHHGPKSIASFLHVFGTYGTLHTPPSETWMLQVKARQHR